MKELKIPEKRYRPEIEGLRTVATLLVAVYHIWFGRVSGGIDVFFVLSGFLITMSLLSRVERSGSVGFWSFLLGLAKRLFPQALLVLFVTAIAAIFIIPQGQWTQIINHLLASTLYFENWRLALDAVDYLAQGQQASPFQHYWSLSLQGQFYVLWPLLIFMTFLLARKVFKTPTRKTLLVVLGGVFVLSLCYSIYKTNTNQPWAYFDTFARVWEFSVGGMFALLLPYIKWHRWFSTVMGWVGLAIVCLTGVVLQVSTVFPGYMALVPISGALLVLVASENSTTFGVDKFLSFKLFTFLGGLSYGFYLWHWPLLRFYQIYFNTPSVPFLHGCLILLLTVILSYISTYLVEAPVRKMDVRQGKRKLVLVLSSSLLPVFVVYFLLVQYMQIDTVQGQTTDYPGAAAIYEEVTPAEDVGYYPSFINVVNDFPSFYQDKECLGKDSVEVKKCSYGVTDDPDYVVALVGGSHSGHWFPTLEILAEEMNFQIDLYNHDGCRFTDQDAENHLTETCLEWNTNLIEELKANPPDLVFTTSTLNKRDIVPEGYIGQWEKLEGITTIFAIRDNPRMKEAAPACLEREADAANCGVPRGEGLSDVLPWENTEGLPSNVIYGDLSDYFCNDDTCPAVIGNVIVYRDDNHLTTAYAKTLAPVLKPQLEEAFESLE